MPVAPTSRSSSRMTAPERREQLLDVTARIAGEQGFHGVSIESVARAAGITRALVYQHFGDLQTLLEATVERETSRALAQVSETAPSDLSQGDPLDPLMESLGAYLRAVEEHPTRWRLVLMPPQGAPESLHHHIARGRAEVLALLTKAVRPALSGEADPPNAELTARMLSALADEYARLVLTDPAAYPPERLLRHARWILRHASVDPHIA